MRELCAVFGWASTRAAVDHIRALERKGRIQTDAVVSRGLRIVVPLSDWERLALGRGAAPSRVVVIAEKHCSCGASYFTSDGCPFCNGRLS